MKPFFKEACRVGNHIALEAEIPPCRTHYEFLSAFRELVCKVHLPQYLKLEGEIFIMFSVVEVCLNQSLG